jgi:TPR repeat protein
MKTKLLLLITLMMVTTAVMGQTRRKRVVGNVQQSGQVQQPAQQQPVQQQQSVQQQPVQQPKAADRSVDEKFAQVLKRAEQGDVDAIRTAAVSFLRAKNLKDAYYWYEIGATKGDPHCLYMMGFAYEGNEVVAADPVKSFTCFKQAAEKGNPTCQAQVAYRYFYGDGVEQDYSQAAYWFEKAIAQGSENDPEDLASYQEMLAKAKKRAELKAKLKK